MRIVPAPRLSGLGLICFVFVAPAAADGCSCVALGRVFQQGQTTCFTLPDGQRFARCDRVLNNSSWTVLGTTCPPQPVRDRAAASIAATEPNEEPEDWPEGLVHSVCLDRDPRG